MRKPILLMAFAILFGTICAQNVKMDEATVVARHFFSAQNRTFKSFEKVITNGQDTLLYIFNAENSYVVIGADKRVPPVLAFSDHQLYNDEDVIAPVTMWLNIYQRQISELKRDRTNNQPVHPLWNALQSRSGNGGFRDEEAVEPLMKSHWGQGTFYNYYCPRDMAGENNRVVTGCVATAMAQLIYYFRFPETGIGSYSYTDENYGLQSADYGATTYNYEAMCDNPSSINPAICTLMHHCGVGVDMVYGPDGSGMYNHSAARVLRNFFKFSPQTEYLFRDSTDVDWDSVIVAHLSRRMPMYYAGWSEPNVNGHGFICDGYKLMDSCYFFHFNFGWDGDYDGYFYTDHLNLMGTHFNGYQELIVNAYPDTNLYDYPIAQPIEGSKTLTALAGSFMDGSDDAANYQPNMNYTWHIQPQTDSITSITLDVEYKLAEGDTLKIFAPNISDSYTITADSGSLHISWETSSMTVSFTSDDQVEDLGFRANYTAVLPEYCRPSQNFTAPSGSFDDGSGDRDYHELSNCTYRIVLPSYSAISVNIEYLDLEDGHDVLRIYKYPINDSNLLAVYTGTMSDTTIVFNEKRLMFEFESDAQGNADGFKINYQAGQVGIDDMEQQSVLVWPNPVANTLRVQAERPIRNVVIRDLQGRILRMYYINDVSGQLNISDFASGLYLLQMEMDGQTVSRKIVKQ